MLSTVDLVPTRPRDGVGAVAICLVGTGTPTSWFASPVSAAQQPAQKPVLNFGENTTPGPNTKPGGRRRACTLVAACLWAIIHENPDGSFAPGLATSWRYVGDDNETFEFTFRQGAHFSDGTEVTASAVKTWLEYFANAKGPYVDQLNLKSVSTVGEWTVVMREKSPTPELASTLADTDIGYVASPKAVANPSLLDEGTDGAGPYVVVPSQSVAGSEYTLVPNAYYYDPSAIRFSKVVVKIISQPSTMLEGDQIRPARGGQTMNALYCEATVSSSPSMYWKAISRRTVLEADTIPLFNFDAFWFTTRMSRA